MSSLKIKKDDLVEVIAGKDKGKRGKVLRIYPREEKVTVEGVNMVTRHIKAVAGRRSGERVRYPGKIHISNVLPVCPETDKPTRVGYRITEGGEKVRFSKRSGKRL